MGPTVPSPMRSHSSSRFHAGNRLWKRFIKASLMKPGVPFDVLLNKDSKRKISSVVSWKRGDRLFGQDAFNIVCFCFLNWCWTMVNYVSRVLDFLLTRSLLSKFFRRRLLTLKSYRTTLQSQPPIFSKPHGKQSVSVRVTEQNGQPKNSSQSSLPISNTSLNKSSVKRWQTWLSRYLLTFLNSSGTPS